MPLFTGFSAVVISEEVTLWSSTFLSFMLVPAIFLPTWLIQVHFVLLDYCFFFFFVLQDERCKKRENARIA